MFKATTNHPEGEFDRILEGSGVEDENAFTSWDYTAFVQELPKDKLDLIAIARVGSDVPPHRQRGIFQNRARSRQE